jgi:hypothetical protein
MTTTVKSPEDTRTKPGRTERGAVLIGLSTFRTWFPIPVRYGDATATLPVGRLNGSKINRHFHEGTHPKEHGTDRDGHAAANAGSAIQLAGDAPALLLPIPPSKAPVQSRYAD